MQPTTTGHNRTGAAIIPTEIDQMMDAVNDLSPRIPINTAPIDAERLKYIVEADSVGSIPPPASLVKGAVKKGVSLLNGINPSLFLDKLGERIAFERASTRVYDALISKYQALSDVTGDVLEPLEDIIDEGTVDGTSATGESALETLQRIRAEEHGHFLLLSDAVGRLGGDPTAQTQRIACRYVAGTHSNHTVCQMPVVRGYQMPWGSRFQSCLPRGFSMSNGSSSAQTATTCGPSAFSAKVMSAEKGVCPPSCVATLMPLTQTRA